MYNLLETFKTNLLLNMRTENLIIDMVLSMMIISLFTYLINERAHFLQKVKDFLNKLFKRKNDKVEITFTAKEYGSYAYSSAKTDYPVSYLSLLYFIDKLQAKKSGIWAIKQITHSDIHHDRYDDDDDLEIDDDIRSIIYTIDQDDKFKLDQHIYCKIENDIKEDRDEKKEGSASNKRDIKSHQLIVFSYTKDLEYLKKFVNKCVEQYEKYIKETNERLQFYETYVSTDKEGYQTFDEYIFSTNRTFDNIYFTEKNNIRKRIDFFTNNKNWYDTRGIPYTLGLMLYGEPGCGKTSFIKALCNSTKRHIIDIPLSRVKSCRELQNVFHKLRINNKDMPFDKRIYIFEDIDCISDIIESRESKEKNMKEFMKNFSKMNKSSSEDDVPTAPNFSSLSSREDEITLSYILNLIDGILETPGRILIITTNHPEKLDKALIRPGRIDIKIKFIRATVHVIIEMLGDFYGKKLTTEQITKMEDVNEKWTPAELLQICGRNLMSLDDAVRDIVELQPEK